MLLFIHGLCAAEIPLARPFSCWFISRWVYTFPSEARLPWPSIEICLRADPRPASAVRPPVKALALSRLLNAAPKILQAAAIMSTGQTVQAAARADEPREGPALLAKTRRARRRNRHFT